MLHVSTGGIHGIYFESRLLHWSILHHMKQNRSRARRALTEKARPTDFLRGTVSSRQPISSLCARHAFDGIGTCQPPRAKLPFLQSLAPSVPPLICSAPHLVSQTSGATSAPSLPVPEGRQTPRPAVTNIECIRYRQLMDGYASGAVATVSVLPYENGERVENMFSILVNKRHGKYLPPSPACPSTE